MGIRQKRDRALPAVGISRSQAALHLVRWSGRGQQAVQLLATHYYLLANRQPIEFHAGRAPAARAAWRCSDQGGTEGQTGAAGLLTSSAGAHAFRVRDGQLARSPSPAPPRKWVSWRSDMRPLGDQVQRPPCEQTSCRCMTCCCWWLPKCVFGVGLACAPGSRPRCVAWHSRTAARLDAHTAASLPSTPATHDTRLRIHYGPRHVRSGAGDFSLGLADHHSGRAPQQRCGLYWHTSVCCRLLPP